MTGRRILIVTEAGDAVFSGFVRGLIYKDLFARAGFDARYISRRSAVIEKILAARHPALVLFLRAGGGWILHRLGSFVAFINEGRILRLAGNMDVVYLLKTNSGFLAEKLRRRTKARVVFDLNDALWLPFFENFAQGRLSEILTSAHAVVCDNDYGAAYARRFNKEVHVVPDSPQLEFFDARRDEVKRGGEKVVLGWIGSASSVFNLFAIWEPLERLFAKHANIHLRLVGVGDDPRCLPPFERVRCSTLPAYSQAEMVEEVLGFDIGLFPLFDADISRSRGILKAAVYMSGGAALACSAVGGCKDLVKDGVNGMMAASADEWLDKMERLVTQPDLRRRLAAAALATVREEYSLEKTFSKLQAALGGGSGS